MLIKPIKHLKVKKKETVDNDEMLKIVNEIKILTKEHRFKNRFVKDLKKDFPREIGKLEEALNKYISEKNHQIMKKLLRDEWKILGKN